MLQTSQYVIIVALLVVIILFIVIAVNNNSNNISDELPKVIRTQAINKEENITIVSNISNKPNNEEIIKYCDKWNYHMSNNSPINNVSLVLQEVSSKINMRHDQSLDFFTELLHNTEYIGFYGTSNYFTRGKYHWNDIKKQITPISYMGPGDISDSAIRNILAHGYPHNTGDGIILSPAYLDLVLYGKSLPFLLPCVMPNITPPRTTTSNLMISKIPKIIHQTFETALLPAALKTAVDTWIELNPDYEHRYYSDNDRRRFIKHHFDSKVLQAYDKLIPGSYRADLWRYCVIYHNGGVYVDIKLGALVPLNNIITDDTSMVVVNDDLPGSMFTSFFAAIPKHPALLQCINIAVQRVLAEEYGPYMVYPTGPLAMGAAILPMYGFKDHMVNGRQQDLLVYSHYREDNNIYVKNSRGERLIKFRYVTNFTEQDVHNITGRPHYKINWKEQTAYRK